MSMYSESKIEWCDRTWNPITGCLHNCEYCYARGIAKRFGGYDEHLHNEITNAILDLEYKQPIHDLKRPILKLSGEAKKGDIMCKESGKKIISAPYPFFFDPTFHRYRLDELRIIKKPQTIFIVSMGDAFGDWVPDEWITEVFKACEATPQHRYLFLTKNSPRYNRYYSFYNDRPKNFYFGASATNYGDMVKIRQTLANSLNFLSLEPLHGDVDLNKFIYENPICLEWVIVGAETKYGKVMNPPKRKWIEEILNACKRADVPVFLKNSLAGIWDEPLIQEFPWEVSK